MTQDIYRIFASDVIEVSQKFFYPYSIIKGIKHISKVYGRARGEKYMLVDEPIWKALEIYQTGGGYGDLGLHDYLCRIFPT